MTVSISDTLSTALADRLEAKLLTDVSDETKADLVRQGRLQDDPTLTPITILVHPGDDTWPTDIYDQRAYSGIVLPSAYEMDGTANHYLRAFVIELSVFLEGVSNRQSARATALTVLSRAEHAIFTMSVPSTRDDFGELASMVQIAESYMREGGGEDVSIWRGAILVEFLTEQEL